MKSVASTRKKKSASPKTGKAESFPVVAIGASVGGLDAMSELLKNLPSDTGMAYIYVQHLNPDHKSILSSILGKFTKMKVQVIENMEHMVPDNVYVIPHDKGIAVTNGHIQLIPRTKTGPAISIDILFSSLAQTHHENVVGVVLSGNASDGTRGLKAIKEAGGLTFAQDSSAQAKSMPESAIASGAVDFILSPKQIARKLVFLRKNNLLKRVSAEKQKITPVQGSDDDLEAVFQLLYKETGVDFSHYKIATIKRRLNHRMLQAGVKSVKQYTKLLLKQKTELDSLYRNLLINVTGFFRDPEVFTYLKTTFLPQLLKSKLPGETLRIWVPACSSGEEAYAIAMLITDLQGIKAKRIPVQIFATDLSEQVIREARIGEYSVSNIRPVPKKYQERFFTKVGDTYRVTKEIREMCVFAPHNILRDPSFSRLDFISCRNLLIYFDSAAQRKVFATMHFALNEKGHLMLGKAESIGTSSQYFSRISNKFKIYSRKKNTGVAKIIELAPHFSRNDAGSKKSGLPAKNQGINSTDIGSAVDASLLSHYMPACAVVNKEMDILEFRGPVSLFLTHATGKASLNILKMARPEFAFELRNAITRAIKTKLSVYKSGMEMEVESVFRMMSFDVSLLKVDQNEQLLLIVFTLQEPVEKQAAGGKGNSTQKDRRIKKLAEELINARAEMNSIIETQEATYEALQAANEEIVSTNEEFQTLNEELETSKEEIQASNEELLSTNQELQMRNDLLNESYEYSEAIIATIHEPMLVLNKSFHVKSANRAFYKKFLVKKEETEGRFLFDLGDKQWEIPRLYKLLNGIVSKNVPFENFEVRHTFPGIGERIMLLNAHLIIQKTLHEKLILLAIEDITEQSDYHQKEKTLLRREKEIAEMTVKAKQRFLSNMSHEIRTPMNAIVGFTRVVLKTELNSKQREYLKAIKTSGDALIVLIDDILDLAKVDAGKMTFEQTPFRLSASVSAMLHLFEQRIQERNLKLIREYDTAIPDVLIGDPVRLHQIVLNLVSNAVKFTNEGEIAISVRLLKEDEEKVTIEFVVADTGIGIAEANQTSIFDDFQQATSETSRVYGGTGLGLAIVKQLVESQGGTISVKSKQGSGSTFSFILNFKKTKELIHDETEIAAPHELEVGAIRILVVEDIALNQLLMRTLLEDFGFEMDIADNGKIAIEKLQERAYDIVLMDLQMPEMSGFEATDYIRNSMKLRTPIIALTADVTTMDIKKCEAIGMDDYISKPIDEKLLLAKIIKHLKRNGALTNAEGKMMDNRKLVNLDYLKKLTRNKSDIIAKMIEVYLGETPLLIQEMEDAIKVKNWDALRIASYSISPSFETMGMSKEFGDDAKSLQQCATTLHNGAAHGKEQENVVLQIDELLGRIKSACTLAYQELKVELLRLN